MPLVFLASLSCPIKQEVKKVLDIPTNNQQQSIKVNSSCYISFRESKVNESRTEKRQTKFSLYTNTLYCCKHITIVSSSNLFRLNTGEIDNSSIPIFLEFRKLII